MTRNVKIAVRIVSAVALVAFLGSLVLRALYAFGGLDSPVTAAGGSIYGSVGALHFFHKDPSPTQYHAARNFKKNSASQIFLACVSYPAGSQYQQLVTIPIDDTISWNLQISTQDDQGIEKPDVASACSNQGCNLTTAPDPNGDIYIQANPSNKSNGWNRSTFGGRLNYFDTSSNGCSPPSRGAESPCNRLTYLTLELATGSTKYSCDKGVCEAYMGGPKAKKPPGKPLACP